MGFFKMFANDVAPVPQPIQKNDVAPVPQPIQKVELVAVSEPTEEYRKLAAKLGLNLKAIQEQTATLEDVLREEMVHIYPMKDVSAYMKKITPKSMVWGWRPLRNRDMKCGEKVRLFKDINYGGRFVGAVYDKAIPYPALLTVEKIEEALRDSNLDAAFFVSDYVARIPDPFLMVTIPALGRSQWLESDGSSRLWTANPEPDCFVVERWDEPSFR